MDRKFTLYNRLGLHYPAGQTYRVADLQTWKPILTQIGAGWLILVAEESKAIPEFFIRGMVENGIQPVLHFKLPLDPTPGHQEIGLLLSAYAKWGVRYAIFFDHPNTRSAWPVSGWTQNELVERFLDRFIPLAESAWQAGIVPILPPLEPGGSYWDTAFLRATLTTLQRRSPDLIRAGLGIAAYAWTFGRSLDWGAGGPERWPAARPYLTPAGSQDQRGFHIFDWYSAVTQATLGRQLPILLLETGSPAGSHTGNSSIDLTTAEKVVRLLGGEAVADPDDSDRILEPLPDFIFSAAINLPDGYESEVFTNVTGSLSKLRSLAIARGAPVGINGAHPIHHYLLLPSFEWGVSEWHLDAIKPFVRKYRPTIGFSLTEATLAETVTVIATENEIHESTLDQLRQSGCRVERIEACGTSLATLLAER